jgi:hypothetical protein
MKNNKSKFSDKIKVLFKNHWCALQLGPYDTNAHFTDGSKYWSPCEVKAVPSFTLIRHCIVMFNSVFAVQTREFPGLHSMFYPSMWSACLNGWDSSSRLYREGWLTTNWRGFGILLNRGTILASTWTFWVKSRKTVNAGDVPAELEPSTYPVRILGAIRILIYDCFKSRK